MVFFKFRTSSFKYSDEHFFLVYVASSKHVRGGEKIELFKPETQVKVFKTLSIPSILQVFKGSYLNSIKYFIAFDFKFSCV